MKAKNIGNLIKSLALSAAMCAPLMAGISFGDNVKAAENELTNVYRAYSPKSGEHVFSTVETYVRNLEPLGWVYEGIAYRGAKDSYSNITAGNSSNRIVYGLREKDAASEHEVKHLYTTDKNEYEVLQKRGWRGDGAIFFAPNTSAYPVHRLFNPRAASSLGAHHYTADANEIRVLVTQGWNDEGIVFYSAGPGEAASTGASTGSVSNIVVSSNAGRSKELEDAYFEELNKIRVSEGLKPYIRNSQMDAAAGSRMDYIIAGFDSGMNVAYKKAQDELKAQELPYLGLGDSKNMLPPGIHDGAEEAFNKYNTDSSLEYYGENAAHHFVYGTASATAKKSLSSTKTYSETYNTAHWPHLMSKQYTQIGIAMYVRGEDLFTCVQFAAPSDGSTLAGSLSDGYGTTWYYDPTYPSIDNPKVRTVEDAKRLGYYILDSEQDEYGKLWQKRLEEGGGRRLPEGSEIPIVEEFRKMKDGK